MTLPTDRTSSGKKGAVSTKGLDKPSIQGANPPAWQDGVGLRLERYFGKPEQIQKLKIPLYAVVGLLVVVELFIHKEHAAFIWDSIPGFSVIYGLIATALIIVVSKFLGLVLTRREDYYD